MEGNADGIFAKEELLPMTKIALPSILQQSTVSIGMMLVQSVVNSFGAEALAGFSAGMRIESICIVPMVAIGNAISSYTAQNIGAGQQKRVVKGYVQANKLVIFFAVLICVVLELFPEQLIALFLGTEGSSTALATGQAYIGFMGFFFCMIGFNGCGRRAPRSRRYENVYHCQSGEFEYSCEHGHDAGTEIWY